MALRSIQSLTDMKVKFSRYSHGVAQRVGRVTALLFHDHWTRSGWVVSSTPRPHSTPGKDAVPILREAGWTPGPVWTGGNSLPHRNSIPDLPARSSVAIPTELPDPPNRYEYQCYFLRFKGGLHLMLTNLPPSCADCHEIWEPQPPGILWVSPGL